MPETIDIEHNPMLPPGGLNVRFRSFDEKLAAVASLLSPKPGDFLVIRCDPAMTEQLRESLAGADCLVPRDVNFLIMPEGFDVSILTAEQAQALIDQLMPLVGNRHFITY